MSGIRCATVAALAALELGVDPDSRPALFPASVERERQGDRRRALDGAPIGGLAVHSNLGSLRGGSCA